MRKYFLSIVALVGMLFATSCQESLVEPQVGGTTTFTVQVPDQMGTKADPTLGLAANVNQLFVAVYADALANNATPIYRAVAPVSNGQATISLNLIQDQYYDVIFWAQVGDNYVSSEKANDEYTFNLVNIPMNKDYHNTDNGAAFFYYWNDFKPTGTSQPVTLRRPFAQLNLGTTEGSLTNNAGTFTLQSSVIKVKGIADNFNTVSGFGTVTEANKDIEYTFDAVALPSDEKINVAGVDYKYVSMDYLPIVGDDQALITVDATITLSNDQSINHKFTNVPVRENYRTNIVGNLISSTTDFIVEVNDKWVGDYTEEYVAPGIRLVNGEYEITSEEGLWSFAELVNGGTKAGGKSFLGKTIKLTCDIDLKNEPWTPISLSTDLANDETFRGTFDGNGHTIKGLYVNRNDVAGLFGYVYAATIKNVTVEGASINSNHYAGGIVGWALNNTGNIKVPMIIENCHVKNSIIASTPELVNGEWDNGDKVGGIIGYAAYIGGTGGDINDGAGIFSCSVESTTIKAYRDFGGIAGYAQSVKIEQPTIQDVTLEQDLTNEYQTTTPTTFGQIIGRDAGGNIVNGVSLAVTVTTSEELEQVVNNATTDITVELGANLEGHVSLTQNAGIDVTIIGNDHTYTGTLHIWGNGATDDRSMTIKNINFVFSTDSEPGEKGCIYTTGSANGRNSYACNVTIEDCTFTNAEGVEAGAAIRQNVAGEKDWTIKNCTVAENMHSLLQVSNTNKGDGFGLLVEGCKVYSKNGANLNSTCYATFIDCEFDVKGYAVRVGVNSGGNPDATKEFNFTGCTLKTENVDNEDAVIVIRKDAEKATFNFVDTELNGDPKIIGYTNDTKINGIDLPKPVAMVGNTEYYSIDEAIAAWTNNTTLTLLADVTLSDVIMVSSTEYHVLDLSTFTMTAASKKDAIQVVNNGRSKASYALDIKADATNPGGITAEGKAIVRTAGKSGVQDRPIIRFYNGVFNASNIINHSGSNGTNCPQFQFHNGVYNGTISANRALIQFYGGTFNGSLMISVDSSAYALISGGRFKQLSNLYGSTLNSGKFTIGSAKGVFDRGVYVDDEGYYVVGGSVITEFGDKFAARAFIKPGVNEYLYYSSAKDNGLYYTNAEMAKEKNKNVTVELK